jgi:hypothetical protein
MVPGAPSEPRIEREELEPLPERPAAVVLLRLITLGRYRSGHLRSYSYPFNASSNLCLAHRRQNIGTFGLIAIRGTEG